MIYIDNPVKVTPERLDFDIHGINSSIANALRRSMISDVHTMAIENVSIIENNGPFTDEVIAHRIGLIPIRVTDKSIKEARFTLDVSFDPEKEDENNIQTVYSKSLKTEDPVSLVYDDIILTKISNNHKLKLEAIALWGSGYVHSKWSPCCGTSFKRNDDGSYRFRIETSGSLTPEETFKEALKLLQEKLNYYL